VIIFINNDNNNSSHTICAVLVMTHKTAQMSVKHGSGFFYPYHVLPKSLDFLDLYPYCNNSNSQLALDSIVLIILTAVIESNFKRLF